MNRQIPNDLPKEEVESCIQEVENLLGRKWLDKSKQNKNKLKNIWNRQDFLSTIELYTIGNALKLIKASNNDIWLNDFCKQVKSPKESNQAGAIFEAVAFSMFANNHQVSLPAPNQAGYDLVISFNEKKLHVSCKCLQNSDKYKQLRSKFHLISSCFKEELVKRKVTGKQLFIHSDVTSQLPSHSKVKQYIGELLNSNVGQTSHSNYSYFIKDIQSDVKGFSLSCFDVSYLVNLVTRYNKSEQVRYEQLFKSATKNISKHSQVESGLLANAIMINLPESISIESAKKWTENKFKSDGSKIAFVILIRLLPAIDQRKNLTKTIIETAFVVNIYSDSSFLELIDYKSGEMLKLSLPVGSIVEGGLNNIIQSDQGELNINGFYSFQKGHISYQANNEGRVEFNLNTQPNISYDMIAKPNPEADYVKIGVIRPPQNEFIAI